MAKLWAGRTDGAVDPTADDFNASLKFDQRMIRQDVRGSMAHASMLGAVGILTREEAETLIDGLQDLLEDVTAGRLEIDPTCEDVHTFVEQTLTARLGDVGKKLHTARSRNDQVAQDLRLYLRDEIDGISGAVGELIAAVTDRAEEEAATVLPGYTHLQRAQPITFGHHLLAYASMLLRDKDRLADCRRRMNLSPIGSCALAGTTYATDRESEAKILGFDGVCLNSIDGVSDRDFCVELAADLALIMTHLSRFAEEMILWSSWEFQFVTLSDAYTTGSSIMPQKKNPDMAELVRGKTGRVYGDLTALLTVLKGLPLAYNKDMQEDKEAIFDACDTVKQCLTVFTGMVRTLTVRREKMKQAAQTGFLNATDLADYLVRKGLPFREAYKISGQIVKECLLNGKTLETLPLEAYQAHSAVFDSDVYAAVDLDACVQRRISAGGTSPDRVKEQIAAVRAQNQA